MKDRCERQDFKPCPSCGLEWLCEQVLVKRNDEQGNSDEERFFVSIMKKMSNGRHTTLQRRRKEALQHRHVGKT